MKKPEEFAKGWDPGERWRTQQANLSVVFPLVSCLGRLQIAEEF